MTDTKSPPPRSDSLTPVLMDKARRLAMGRKYRGAMASVRQIVRQEPAGSNAHREAMLLGASIQDELGDHVKAQRLRAKVKSLTFAEGPCAPASDNSPADGQPRDMRVQTSGIARRFRSSWETGWRLHKKINAATAFIVCVAAIIVTGVLVATIRPAPDAPVSGPDVGILVSAGSNDVGAGESLQRLEAEQTASTQSGEQKRDLPATPTANADKNAWKEFVSKEGAFSVLMPGTPVESQSTTKGPLRPRSFGVSALGSQVTYVVVYVDLAGATFAATLTANSDELLEPVMDEGKVLTRRDCRIQGIGADYPGKEVTIEQQEGTTPSIVSHVRSYLVMHRLYYLRVDLPRGHAVEDVQKFFNSFKLTSDLDSQVLQPFLAAARRDLENVKEEPPEEYYAAIALSRSTGLYGYSYRHPSRAAAEQAARKACNVADARVVIWANNKWCALAVGDRGGAGWAAADTPQEAQNAALQLCAEVTTGGYIAVCLSAHEPPAEQPAATAVWQPTGGNLLDNIERSVRQHRDAEDAAAQRRNAPTTLCLVCGGTRVWVVNGTRATCPGCRGRGFLYLSNATTSQGPQPQTGQQPSTAGGGRGSCLHCNATGKTTCSRCNGSGRLRNTNAELASDPKRYGTHDTDCSKCNGTGKQRCADCGGDGRL